MTPRRRCCGTPSPPSSGAGPPSPSSAPWPAWSACTRPGYGRWSAISYAKVAEYQRRGAIHFHAVIRLDAATDCRCPGCLAPPPEPFTAGLLEDALRQAVPAVRVPCPPCRWRAGPVCPLGEQLDVHNITTDNDQAGELSAEQVAGYIAKYATKATESFGSGLDRRLTADDLDGLDKLPAARRQARPGGLGAGRPPGVRRAAAAGLGAHAGVRRVIGRPRAAATRPPSPSCGGPGSPSPSAAGPATVCPWMPGAGPRTTRP